MEIVPDDEIKYKNLENELEKESERIAIEALGGLKLQQPFLKRVQNIPLVGRTVSSISNVYESTKNSNNVLKYSAESVESLSFLITKPVLNTLEPVLRPLDRFASNQLDKVEKQFPSLRSVPATDLSTSLPPIKHNASIDRNVELPPIKMHLFETENVPLAVSVDGYSNIRLDQSPVTLPSPTSSHVVDLPRVSSRWGLARLGDDTIRALKYCLSFLKYAIDNMTYQLSVLKQVLANTGHKALNALSFRSSNEHESALQTASPSETLLLISKVKREIVETLRKVIDTLGKYSSSYLPVDARNSVRNFILSLPSRFAVVKQSSTNGAIELDQNVEIEANKVFALGTESTNMLQNIEHVIGKSISAAEYTLGHKTPLEITEPIPKFHTRYSSDNASDLTITTSGDRNDVSDHCDVEMN